MNDPVKRHKSSKFNKVNNNIFKNAKKLSINKSLKDKKLLTENFSPLKNRKGRTKSNRNLTNNLLFKKNSAMNSISITNKTMKRFLSNSKINIIKCKDSNFLKKKSVPININEKEEEKQDLSKYFNPETKNKEEHKKFVSSNNINHIFKSIINNNDLNKKVNTFKKTKLFEKEYVNGIKKSLAKPKSKRKDKENVKDNENIKDKENKLGKEIKKKKNPTENKENKLGKEYKGKKSNKLKIINNEKKENIEENVTQEKEKYEKYEEKSHKFKFFCCL